MLRRSPLFLILIGLAAGGWAGPARTDVQAFDELSLTLEVNATDGSSEVILHAETGLPLEQVAVIAPDGRLIQRLDASCPGGIGLSELRLESGEPGLAAVMAAYPEGRYTVRARTLEGRMVVGEVFLAHDLPARWPMALASNADAANGIDVSWTSDARVARYALELVDETDDASRLAVTPLPGRSDFRIPSDLLLSSHTYKVILTATSPSGNTLLQERLIHTR